jgi:hypothetical protein
MTDYFGSVHSKRTGTGTGVTEKLELLYPVVVIDISQYGIDCFLGSLCYIRNAFRLNCLTAQLSYEGRAVVVEGAN